MGGKVVVEGGRAWDAFPPYSPFLAAFSLFVLSALPFLDWEGGLSRFESRAVARRVSRFEGCGDTEERRERSKTTTISHRGKSRGTVSHLFALLVRVGPGASTFPGERGTEEVTPSRVARLQSWLPASTFYSRHS